MAITQTVTCDICGKVKGETNHWFALLKGYAAFLLYPASQKVKTADYTDLCGQECASKALSIWMQR